MRKVFLVVSTAIVLAPLFALAQVQEGHEYIRDFSVELTVLPDSRLEVRETIRYDFGANERHGIFREIPTRYETTHGMRTIGISVEEVARNNTPAPYKRSSTDNGIRIRIGDPDRTITGTHTYTLRYTVRGALNHFADFDELYWNVTGNEWDVPIRKAEAMVTIPEPVGADALQAACYAGVRGASASCADLSVRSRAVKATHDSLAAGEGLTVAVGFPKGIVTEPSTLDRVWWWMRDNAVVFLPFLALFVMLWVWYTRGRDPKGRGTIIARYEPPEGMAPVMAGALVNERVDDRDISAGVISLAEQGFIHIERTEGTKLFVFTDVDYTFTLKRAPDDASPVEKKLISSLFGDAAEVGATTKLSALKGDRRVKKKIKELRKHIHEELVVREYVTRNRARTIGLFWGIGVGAAFGVGILLVLVGATITPVVSVSLIATALVVGVVGTFMPQKTKKGALMQEHLKGFKEFLSVTQKERLAFHNAPERTPRQFMEYLPYAIAFHIETQWAEQFADMYIEPPEWYAGTFHGNVSAMTFAAELAEVGSGIESNVAATGGSGSGGGGASGGGTGGGGGGSW